MFKSQKMSKLLIAASKDQLDPIVRELYRHNAFHIEEYVEHDDEKIEGFRIGMPLSGAGEYSSKLLKVRSIKNAVGLGNEYIEADRKEESNSVYSRLDNELPSIEEEIIGFVDERTKLETRLREYEQKLSELAPFIPFGEDLSLCRGYEGFTAIAGRIPADVEIPVPNEKFFSSEAKGNILIAIIPRESLNETEQFLFGEGFQSIPIPDEEGVAAERSEWYTHEITRLKDEIGKIEEQISDRKDKYALSLVAFDELLTADVERAEAPLRFATSDLSFVCEGWVPSDKTDEIVDSIRKSAGGSVFITTQEYDPVKESVPIEFDNPNFAKPTELLLDIYSRPQYSEIDPTLLMSIVFPIFFGFILGDVGYGIMLLALSFALRKMVKGSEAGNQLLKVLRNSSISGIIFGILYSEFLGFSLPWAPIGINRHLNIGGHATGHGPDTVLMLILTVWIGILHITLGRGIHIINAYQEFHPGKHRNKVIFGQIGWILVMWGILILLWSLFEMPLMPVLAGYPAVFAGFSATMFIGAIMILTGIICIGQESALELIELPTIISHTLSYARLAAVGLSSVAIAMVINYISIGMMVEPAIEEFSILSIFIIIVGIVVFLFGHILNTVLGLLEGGLHSIRLHYVEFFTKFYKGGGKKYNPFGMKRKYTED